MAEEKRVVIPADMGKTIEFGTTEADKWNVKHDSTLLTKADGSLSVVPPGCNRITNLNTMAGLPSGDGTFCIYGFHNGNDKIPGIMVNATATSETQPRWESGETTADYDWNGWVTRAGNQMTVYINQGNATWSSVNDDASAAPAGWTEWRRVENVAPPKMSGGLDCDTISALPQKPWKKGTTVLGQQDGKCIRLVPTENLFQEIGVALSANKLSGEVGDTYHVVAIVTNSGESTNEVTDLTITKPALGSYTVSNFRTSTSTGASIERVSDYAYKVKKLATGGTAKVEFDVVANSGGTFQFGAAVNPNTAFDLQSNNNQATITLSARIQQNPDIVPSADCPIIELTVDGTKLVSHSKSGRAKGLGDNLRIGDFQINFAQELLPVTHLATAIKYYGRGDWDFQKAFDHVANGIAKSVVPWQMAETGNPATDLAYALVPTMFQPLVLQSAGVNYFGNEIAPTPYDSNGNKWMDAPDAFRATTGTTGISDEVARGLYDLTGGMIDVAPNSLDMFMQQGLGSLFSVSKDIVKRMNAGENLLEAGANQFTKGHTTEYNVFALKDETEDRFKKAMTRYRIGDDDTILGKNDWPPEYQELKDLYDEMNAELKALTGSDGSAKMSDLFGSLNRLKQSDSPSPDEFLRITNEIESLSQARNYIYGKYNRILLNMGY